MGSKNKATLWYLDSCTGWYFQEDVIIVIISCVLLGEKKVFFETNVCILLCSFFLFQYYILFSGILHVLLNT